MGACACSGTARKERPRGQGENVSVGEAQDSHRTFHLFDLSILSWGYFAFIDSTNKIFQLCEYVVYSIVYSAVGIVNNSRDIFRKVPV